MRRSFKDWDLVAEVERFRAWAALDDREKAYGDWEVNYPDWNDLCTAAADLLDQKMPDAWREEEVRAFLEAMARDHECEAISSDLFRDCVPEAYHFLAHAADRWGEPDAKWQIANGLGKVPELAPEMEALLLRWADDENEFLCRNALMALAEHRSSAVDPLADSLWNRPHECREWIRISVLWALHRAGSGCFEGRLQEALADPGEHLAEYAGKLQRGEIG